MACEAIASTKIGEFARGWSKFRRILPRVGQFERVSADFGPCQPLSARVRSNLAGLGCSFFPIGAILRLGGQVRPESCKSAQRAQISVSAEPQAYPTCVHSPKPMSRPCSPIGGGNVRAVLLCGFPQGSVLRVLAKRVGSAFCHVLRRPEVERDDEEADAYERGGRQQSTRRGSVLTVSMRSAGIEHRGVQAIVAREGSVMRVGLDASDGHWSATLACYASVV